MSKASFGVTYEGFVTHILSGFNIPVVNIQGGIGIMNYDNNINLKYDHFKTPCASTYPCAHCDEANENITIETPPDTWEPDKAKESDYQKYEASRNLE